MNDAEDQRLLKSLEAQVSLIDKFVDKVYQYQPDLQIAESRAVALMHEASEVSEIFYKSNLYHKPMDRQHLRQELGDVLYNVQAVAHYMSFSLAECIESSNISVRSKKLCQNM